MQLSDSCLLYAWLSIASNAKESVPEGDLHKHLPHQSSHVFFLMYTYREAELGQKQRALFGLPSRPAQVVRQLQPAARPAEAALPCGPPLVHSLLGYSFSLHTFTGIHIADLYAKGRLQMLSNLNRMPVVLSFSCTAVEVSCNADTTRCHRQYLNHVAQLEHVLLQHEHSFAEHNCSQLSIQLIGSAPGIPVR